LIRDTLSAVAETIKLRRRTLRIVQFNIVFTLIVKAVFLVLALLADAGATLLVITNGLQMLAVRYLKGS
jgi:Cd2+/Zn2+-exporting ATPase